MWYGVLSHAWSGLLVAAMVGAVACALIYLARRLQGQGLWARWVRVIGYIMSGLAVLTGVGGTVALWRIEFAERAYPPMGRRVDVGGYRMHVIAEGEAHGTPTVVWIGGAHSQGLAFYPLHKILRQQTRSILFDRPGSGWSDVGPFPRRTSLEVDELHRMLQAAGERGPFVVVGHSYGGLLAANFARRHREQVVGLVLLDATPPDSIIYPPLGGDGMAQYGHLSQLLGLSKLVGLQIDVYDLLPKGNADVARMLKIRDRLFADVQDQMRANEAGPASNWAAASLMTELNAAHIKESAPQLVVYDGELSDLPVFVVVPRDDLAAAVAAMPASPADKERASQFLARVRLRYLATSSRSQLIYAPAGTSHNFPYEQPEFVAGIVRRALAEPRDANVGSPTALVAPGQSVGSPQGTPVHLDLITHNTVHILAPARFIWPLLFQPDRWKASIARSEHVAGTPGAVGEQLAIYTAEAANAVAYDLLAVEVRAPRRLVWRIFRPSDTSVVGYASFQLDEHDGVTDLSYDVYAYYQPAVESSIDPAALQEQLRVSTSAKVDADNARLKAWVEKEWRRVSDR